MAYAFAKTHLTDNNFIRLENARSIKIKLKIMCKINWKIFTFLIYI